MFSNFSKLLGICLWVMAGFFVAQFGIALIIGLLVELNLLRTNDLDKPLLQLVRLAAAYSLALVIIVMGPQLFQNISKKNFKKQLGILKKPKLTQLALSLPGYVVYLVLTITFSVLIQVVWRSFNANQAQQVGFQSLSGGYEYIIAFTALVLVAPIVEELLFRGYLFGRLRDKAGFWLSALITSVLFGFVHLQWNVGVDVFALSLVLCYLREKTGTVWVGVVLHMIKNAIAFTLLFLHPELLKNVL